jgi:hypothetical protein
MSWFEILKYNPYGLIGDSRRKKQKGYFLHFSPNELLEEFKQEISFSFPFLEKQILPILPEFAQFVADNASGNQRRVESSIVHEFAKKHGLGENWGDLLHDLTIGVNQEYTPEEFVEDYHIDPNTGGEL